MVSFLVRLEVPLLPPPVYLSVEVRASKGISGSRDITCKPQTSHKQSKDTSLEQTHEQEKQRPKHDDIRSIVVPAQRQFKDRSGRRWVEEEVGLGGGGERAASKCIQSWVHVQEFVLSPRYPEEPRCEW